MEKSAPTISTGKKLIRTIGRHILLFFSPKEFWAVAAYWVYLVLYVGLDEADIIGFAVPFKEEYCPFVFSCSDKVSIFFYIIPILFIYILFIELRWLYRRNCTLSALGLIHIWLIVLCTFYVNVYTFALIWFYGYGFD